VEVEGHSVIGFKRVRMTNWLFLIFVDGVISDESLTVSLYLSGCGEDEGKIEGNIYACRAIPIHVLPIHIKRIRKLFVSPTVNTNGVTHNTLLV